MPRYSIGDRTRTHGLTGTPEHKIWANMRSRCSNPNVKCYYLYGGRGIKVCDRWDSFEAFLADMGHRPSPKHSIERRNSDGDYSPDNCYWATAIAQARNKRNNRRITAFAEEKGVDIKTICTRLARGWSGERAMDPVYAPYQRNSRHARNPFRAGGRPVER